MRDNKSRTLVFHNSGGTLLDVTGRSLSSVAKPIIQLTVVISRAAESSSTSDTTTRVGLHRISVNSSLESIIIIARMRFYSGLRINLNVIRILSAAHFEVIIFVQFYYPNVQLYFDEISQKLTIQLEIIIVSLHEPLFLLMLRSKRRRIR